MFPWISISLVSVGIFDIFLSLVDSDLFEFLLFLRLSACSTCGDQDCGNCVFHIRNILSPIHRMTGTAMLLPIAMYRGVSGHCSDGLFLQAILV